mmetsp:Transcript_132641/g.330838  ORF Transcript_132641/g.330838 Transcript_132641/m.330838 type:complete len:657 (-) Transcript_132641:107-2077(-)
MMEAPICPSEPSQVLQSSRSGSSVPPDIDLTAAKAAELLSNFFDSRDSVPAGLGVDGAQGGALEPQDAALAVRLALNDQPLEYLVVRTPFAHLRAEPSSIARSVGRLKYGTIVRGFPAGQWLHLDRSEVERRRLERRCDWSPPVPDSGAWVLVDCEPASLVPRWAVVTVDGVAEFADDASSNVFDEVELAWPGLPRSLEAVYSVHWRPLGSCGSPGAGGGVAVVHPDGNTSSIEARLRLAELRSDEAWRVRVAAEVKGGIHLLGAWIEVPARHNKTKKGEEAKIQRHHHRFGGAEAAALARRDPRVGSTMNGRGQGIFGSMLLPGKYKSSGCIQISDAVMWITACTPANMLVPGPRYPEEPRHRAFITQTTPPIFLLELNSLSTFNMMDAVLSADVMNSMDCIKDIFNMPSMVHNRPRSYVVQGSGPHFCPGGNPNPILLPGTTPIVGSQYIGYLGFVQCRELGLPGVCALHGSMVGGGVAYSLNLTKRIGTSALSVCYGNISRGAVPGMELSSNVVETLGLAGAVELYLSDSTLSSYALVKAGYLTAIATGNAQVKSEGIVIGKSIATNNFGWKAPLSKHDLDVNRFATEILGINLSGRTGVLFASVRTKKKEAGEEAGEAQQQQPQQQLQQQEEDWERRPRPKRRPKRRARPRQ